MRIGINAHLVRNLVSGVEYYIHDLVMTLADRDGPHSYVLYANERAIDGYFAGMTRLERRPAAYSGENRARRIAWEQCILPGRARGDALDLLHAPAYVIPMRRAVETIVTIPDVIALKHPRLCRPSSVLYYRSLLPLSARRAKRIITFSECSKNDIVRHCNVEDAKIEVIPLAAHEMFHAPRDENEIRRTRMKHDVRGKVILFVGNLEPKKNVERLVEALHALQRSHGPDFTLVIAGHRGAGYPRIRARVNELGLASSVRFTGYVARRDLRALYHAADVFAFPSLYEGFGLPPLEAMACGTPVVSSCAGSLGEVVGDAAEPVDPLDAADIARGIFKVLTSDSVRDGMVRKGRARAALFSWRATADGTERTYESCFGDA